MKVIIRVKDGFTCVDIVDPSDGTIVRGEIVGDDELLTVVATTATSASDLKVYGPEAIPKPEAEAAEAGEGKGLGGAKHWHDCLGRR